MLLECRVGRFVSSEVPTEFQPSAGSFVHSLIIGPSHDYLSPVLETGRKASQSTAHIEPIKLKQNVYVTNFPFLVIPSTHLLRFVQSRYPHSGKMLISM